MVGNPGGTAVTSCSFSRGSEWSHVRLRACGHLAQAATGEEQVSSSEKRYKLLNCTRGGSKHHKYSTTICTRGSSSPLVPPTQTENHAEWTKNDVFVCDAITWMRVSFSFSIDTGISDRFGATFYPRLWNGRIHYTPQQPVVPTVSPAPSLSSVTISDTYIRWWHLWIWITPWKLHSFFYWGPNLCRRSWILLFWIYFLVLATLASNFSCGSSQSIS